MKKLKLLILLSKTALQTQRNFHRLGVGSLAVILAAFLWTQPSLAQDQLSYVIESGTITIVPPNWPSNSVLIIPETINGLPVTRIYDYAFADCTNLTSITIPYSVTSIGSPVFYGCSNLTSIEVDPANPSYSSVDGVLFNKSQTVLIACPGGKTGDYVGPDGVGSIGPYAFSTCTSLSSITIPNSVHSIGESAFYRCTNATTITIPNSVASIGERAFWDCTRLTRITIPTSLTSIESGTFINCTSLTSVTIPNSVTSIGVSAFVQCTSLTNIVIGNGVTDLTATFYNLPSLTAFEVDPANPAYSSVDGVLLDQSQTLLISWPAGKKGAYIIPNSVTAIGAGAFSLCTNLTSITIPNSVTSIGGSAFYRCTGLKGMYFQGNAPSADVGLFEGSDDVTVYYLPGTTGWTSTFVGRPTALWTNPLLLTGSGGVSGNGLALRVSWSPNARLVVEACADLAGPVWSPISTNTPSSGSWTFFDPDSSTHPKRFYRVRSP